MPPDRADTGTSPLSDSSSSSSSHRARTEVILLGRPWARPQKRRFSIPVRALYSDSSWGT